jgi:hypothetical protein
MRIGFLCSEARTSCIQNVIDTFFPDIDPIYLIDDLYYFSTETEKKLLGVKDLVNGFIFGGELQFHYYNYIFQPNIPCDYVSKDWSSLQNALLSIGRLGIDFSSVSIDSYSVATVRNIYHDTGLMLNETEVKIIDRKVFGKQYIDYVVEKHQSFYAKGEVKGCITALAPVHQQLTEKNIPCVYAHPTIEIVSKTVEKIRNQYEFQKGKSASFAMILINLIPKQEHSSIRKDEYLYMHEKIKVAEEVYFFAKDTNAAVLNDSLDKFIILMNRNDLIEYTNGLQKFYLINEIHNNTNFDINMGIGYGFTPGQAKFNANLAIEKFDGHTKNMAYVVIDSSSILGPIDFLAHSPKDEVFSEEHLFLELSKMSGISKSILWNLYSLIEKNKKNTYTSSELSKKLCISQRSSSRMLRKLEDSHLARIVNKEVTGTSGRPSDIYEITLFVKD